MADNDTSGVLRTEGVPTYLVAFEEVSEKNEEIVASMMGGGKPKETDGVLSFRAARGRRGSATYRRHLAVAEMDMSEEDASELRTKSGVAAVERNEIMSIPRPIAATGAGTDDDDDTGPELPGSMDQYLRGIRDLADMLLGTEGVRFRPPVTPRDQVSGNALTWGLSAIGSPLAGFTGKGVKVAVLDTGLDLTHPDFQHVSPGNTASFVGTATVQDGHGHGTHCCGTVAGPTRPARGPRYGVAPDVELLVGKVLADDGRGFSSQIIDGINWAIDNGARVISMSLGSARNPGAPFSRVYETVFRQALAQGVLVIVAAGNESGRPGFIAPVGNPAACPSAMAVAALDRHDKVARFSCGEVDNVGKLDLSGPGVAVHSSWTGGGYETISGTSMATPHVAGTAALFLEQNPKLSPGDLSDLLKDSTRPLTPWRDFGTGLVRVPASGTPVGRYGGATVAVG